MANGLMYEGDGFIRKGPTPAEVAGKEARVETRGATKAAKPARRGHQGITWFRFTRLVFGR